MGSNGEQQQGELLAQLEQKVCLLETENNHLKKVLEENTLGKKMELVQDLSHRLNTYIEATGDTNLREIQKIEQKIIHELGAMTQETKQRLQQEEDRVRTQVARNQQEVQEQMKAISNQPLQAKRYPQVEQIADTGVLEVVQPKTMPPNTQTSHYLPKKKANIELKIGLDIVNKIGMVLILIGMIIGMRYTYVHFFTPELKGIMGAVFGLIFLGAGTYFHKKDKKVFATGLTGGGIAIFYITIFVSYFMLKIINLPVAIVLSILVSSLSFILCHVLNSQTVALFALVGGYLPIVTYGVLLGEIGGFNALFIASYILLLNLVTLMISLKKNWPLVGYMSFVFNIPATIWCTVMLFRTWEIIAYIALNFIMYIGIVFAQPFVYRTKLRVGHVIVTAVNTTLSSVLLCIVLSLNGMGEQFGLVCAGFSIVYFVLERITKKYLPEEEAMRLVFYVTSLTFGILIIPFQLTGVWIVMGWVIEGLLFVIYGRRSKQSLLEVSGIGLLVLSSLVYYFIEYWQANEVWWKFGIIVVALNIVMVVYLRAMEKGELEDRWDAFVIAYEYFTLFNVVLYLQYNIKALCEQVSKQGLEIALIALGVSLLIVGIAIAKVSLLKKSMPKHMSTILYGFVAFIGPVVSIGSYGGFGNAISDRHMILVGVYQLAVILSVWGIYRELSVMHKKYTVTSVIGGIIYTILDVQIFVSFSWPYDKISAHVMISILCALISWWLISIGFKHKVKAYRYSGLGLVTYAFGKLFLYDIIRIGSGYSIISFFGFGVILLGISYIYQKFAKSIENEEEL